MKALSLKAKSLP